MIKDIIAIIMRVKDNKRINLRICTISENIRNQKVQKQNKSSIYKGVHFFAITNKWVAAITYNKKRFHLGYFHEEVDAVRAYNEKAIELFGSFANLNVVK